MSEHRVDCRGVRLNPNLRSSENIYVQIAKHRAKQGKTTKQLIQDVLDH